jgi:hypothetical protein
MIALHKDERGKENGTVSAVFKHQAFHLSWTIVKSAQTGSYVQLGDDATAHAVGRIISNISPICA